MAYTQNRRLSEAYRKSYDFDPDSTSTTAVGWLSLTTLGGVDSFIAGLFRSVGTGSVGVFNIQAATSSSGAGATVVASHALGTAPDAVGDQVYLEVSGEQIKAALAAATHISACIGLVTSTDECVVSYEAHPLFHTSSTGTADIIA